MKYVINENLNWKKQVSDLPSKLNRENTTWSKSRSFKENCDGNLPCDI